MTQYHVNAVFKMADPTRDIKSILTGLMPPGVRFWDSTRLDNGDFMVTLYATRFEVPDNGGNLESFPLDDSEVGNLVAALLKWSPVAIAVLTDDLPDLETVPPDKVIQVGSPYGDPFIDTLIQTLHFASGFDDLYKLTGGDL